MASINPRPVVVSLNVEGFGGHESDTIEIPREKWDAMSPRERGQYLEQAAEDFGTNYVNWGWHIADRDDEAGVA